MIKGKIIGAILGAFSLGPLGALCGLALGHIADSVSGAANAGCGIDDGKIFALSAAISKLAKIDGRVSEAEISEIERIFADLQFDTNTRAKAISSFRTVKGDSSSFDDSLSRLAEAFGDIQSRTAVFNILVRVAFADGSPTAEVRNALASASRILGVSASGFFSSVDDCEDEMASNDYKLSEAYAVLGVSPNSSDSDIKRTYREKCKELHPDVLRSKGVGDYAIEALQNELCRVNDAYDLISKQRNIK